MSAKIIDGKEIAKEIRAEIREKVAALVAKGITPGLGVILVGEDPSFGFLRHRKGKSTGRGRHG